MEMFDEEGSNIWSVDYDIYGRIRKQHTGKPYDCPFRYQGQYEDEETGLSYSRFRYYDNETGRFISQDPSGLKNGGPNLYAYVRNPNISIDPLGLYTYYQLKDDDGNVVYHGITERPVQDRLTEHAADGKEFSKVSYVDDLDTRADARNMEGSALHHDREKDLLNKQRPVSEGYYHSYDPDNVKEGRTFMTQAEIDEKMKNAHNVDVDSKGKIKVPCH